MKTPKPYGPMKLATTDYSCQMTDGTFRWLRINMRKGTVTIDTIGGETYKLRPTKDGIVKLVGGLVPKDFEPGGLKSHLRVWKGEKENLPRFLPIFTSTAREIHEIWSRYVLSKKDRGTRRKA